MPRLFDLKMGRGQVLLFCFALFCMTMFWLTVFCFAAVMILVAIDSTSTQTEDLVLIKNSSTGIVMNQSGGFSGADLCKCRKPLNMNTRIG